MVITRNGTTYYSPDAQTQLIDGVWTGLLHKELLPVPIKQLQDQEHELLLEPYPSDEELMEFARLAHPVAEKHERAKQIRTIIQEAWDQYVAAQAELGITVLNGMPEYGGMID